MWSSYLQVTKTNFSQRTDFLYTLGYWINSRIKLGDEYGVSRMPGISLFGNIDLNKVKITTTVSL